MEPNIAVPKGRHGGFGGAGGPPQWSPHCYTGTKKTLSQKYLVKKKYFDTTPGASGRSLTHNLGLVGVWACPPVTNITMGQLLELEEDLQNLYVLI